MATLFDQNHENNHKNSMASQTVLAELEEGDRIQVRREGGEGRVWSSVHRVLNRVSRIWSSPRVWSGVSGSGINFYD